MAYRVEITPHARRNIRRLPRIVQSSIISMLERLEENAFPPGVRKLQGTERNRYRVRVGNYRIIYDIEDIDDIEDEEDSTEIEGIIYVAKVGHRRDVYR